jgi:hypothetical protein
MPTGISADVNWGKDAKKEEGTKLENEEEKEIKRKDKEKLKFKS